MSSCPVPTLSLRESGEGEPGNVNGMPFARVAVPARQPVRAL